MWESFFVEKGVSYLFYYMLSYCVVQEKFGFMLVFE